MKWHKSSMVIIFVLTASLVLLCGCQQQHMAIYQNGVNLGEWDLHQEGKRFVTNSGQEVDGVPAKGIPLDTVTVGGGVIILTQSNK